MNFKLAVDTGGGSGATGGTDDALNDGGGGGGGMMLHVGGGGGGDDEAATESRLRRWTGDEETSIKEPTWYDIWISPPTPPSPKWPICFLHCYLLLASLVPRRFVRCFFLANELKRAREDKRSPLHCILFGSSAWDARGQGAEDDQ
jgi:hypothetical protein